MEKTSISDHEISYVRYRHGGNICHEGVAVIPFKYRLNDCMFLSNGQAYAKVVKYFTVWDTNIKSADLVADTFGAANCLIAERDE